jgi:hypothetical protein
MTRQERTKELNRLITTEEGLTQLDDIYRRKCPEMAGEADDVTTALKIDQILEAEFPSPLPGSMAEG